MSFFSDLVGAFKKAIGRKPKVDIEEVRSSGGLGPSNPTDAFDKQRTGGPPGGDSEIVDTGNISVTSSDPEEGGEVIEPDRPTVG